VPLTTRDLQAAWRRRAAAIGLKVPDDVATTELARMVQEGELAVLRARTVPAETTDFVARALGKDGPPPVVPRQTAPAVDPLELVRRARDERRSAEERFAATIAGALRQYSSRAVARAAGLSHTQVGRIARATAGREGV
jgi:hypothetical protein